MSIKIDRKNKEITIRTKNTMYIMKVWWDKYLLNMYYGKNTPKVNLYYRCPRHYFSPYPGEIGFEYSPDVVASEFPVFGSGDLRTTALRLRNLENGSDTTRFVYRNARKFKGRADIPDLPCADADENTETLEVTLSDEVTGSELKLYYTVLADCDVISRYFTLENKSDCRLRIEKCMMLSLDIRTHDLDMISFYGCHARERTYQRHHIMEGNQSVFSRRGASSHEFNPFFMLCDPKATEERGSAYGFNLVYSGSFLCEVETERSGMTRVTTGLGAENFSYLLEAGEKFASPEAVMTYSQNGIGQVSRNMHKFVRNHILPRDKFPRRPVVLNSWEAFSFNIDENIMSDFAAEAKKTGMDMVVMDDGWFGKRINARAGLGDWYPNPDRFPGGLAPFIDRIKSSGIKFGIWIEPEMVNPDSDLYRAHPEWVLASPGVTPLQTRNQYVLDMANPEVLAYLKDVFSKAFDGLPIDYIKWDMNRHLSDVYSSAIPPERQGECRFRFMKGVYSLFQWFTEHFPNTMIENCSGGGGRYDLGMMKYSTQIWTSDNVDPVSRTRIQYGSTFGYPVSTMSCHVANNNGSMNDPRLLDFGFRAAMNGALGYEFDILKVSDEVKETISRQIEEYRSYEQLILSGDFYRLQNPVTEGKYSYYFVDGTNSEILLTYLQNEGDPKKKPNRLKISRADKDAAYRDTVSGEIYSGADLKKGITVQSDEHGCYAKMFHFVKIND